MGTQRDSIFRSSLRGFFRSLFILLGIFSAFFVAGFALFSFSSVLKVEEKTNLEVLPNLNWKRDPLAITAPVVLQVNIHGVIGDPEHLDTKIMQSILLDSRSGLLDRDRVKAILLHFNTPGGTVFDSDNIYRLLLKYKERYKVPVFGFVEGMCASGGMYIASAADRLFCSPSAIVGSVGVIIGPFFNIYDVIAKIGVQAKTITAGLDKDMMNPLRPWKADEDQNLQLLISHTYQQFVDIVTSARPKLDKKKLVNEYGAKIFDGQTAQELGYVDVANSDYETALAALLKEANIDVDKPYQVVLLSPRHSFLTEWMQGKHGVVKHKLCIGSDYQIRDAFAYLYTPSH